MTVMYWTFHMLSQAVWGQALCLVHVDFSVLLQTNSSFTGHMKPLLGPLSPSFMVWMSFEFVLYRCRGCLRSLGAYMQKGSEFSYEGTNLAALLLCGFLHCDSTHHKVFTKAEYKLPWPWTSRPFFFFKKIKLEPVLSIFILINVS